ncbi:MAG: hypothetical protein SWY16_01575 [Cyanobacteriota bacterium]|nr:hypothetical protein [Cyanobacteriota bacterium]
MTLFNRTAFAVSAVALAFVFGEVARAEVQFEAPDNSAPSTSIGGGTRGNAQGDTPVNDAEIEGSSACAIESETPEASALTPIPEDEESAELNFLDLEEMTSTFAAEDSPSEDSQVQITDETPSDEMTQVHQPTQPSNCEREALSDEI